MGFVLPIHKVYTHFSCLSIPKVKWCIIQLLANQINPIDLPTNHDHRSVHQKAHLWKIEVETRRCKCHRKTVLLMLSGHSGHAITVVCAPKRPSLGTF